MVNVLEVNKVADMVADMEVDKVADMELDKVVDKVADMVAEMEVDKVADMVADMEVDTILTNFHHYDNIRLERPKGVKDKVKHARSGLKVGVQRVPRLLF